MGNPWEWATKEAQRLTRLGSKGPWITASGHAVISVLGLVVPLPFVGLFPLGIVGMAVFWRWHNPWLWLASSVASAAWYFFREKRQQNWSWEAFRSLGWRMFLRAPLDNNGVRRSWAQRWDPVLDVVFPWTAVAIQGWVLLGAL